ARRSKRLVGADVELRARRAKRLAVAIVELTAEEERPARRALLELGECPRDPRADYGVCRLVPRLALLLRAGGKILGDGPAWDDRIHPTEEEERARLRHRDPL